MADGSDLGYGALDNCYHVTCEERKRGGGYGVAASKSIELRGINARPMAATQIVQSAPTYNSPYVEVV